MSLFLIGDYERNGYHDSDFFAIYFDSDTKSVTVEQTGSTAYAGGIRYNENHVKITDDNRAEVRTQVEKALTRRWLNKLIRSEQFEIEGPSNVNPGQRIKVIQAHTNIEKVTEDCRKCNASGKWVNPRNSNDQRDCFACKGAGQFKTRTAVKNEKGKQSKIVIEEGITGTVLDCNAYGTFYASGYNKPNRFNRQVKAKLDDGRLVTIPLQKLSLCDSEGAKLKDFIKAAINHGKSLDYSVVAHYAWLTYDFLVEPKFNCFKHGWAYAHGTKKNGFCYRCENEKTKQSNAS